MGSEVRSGGAPQLEWWPSDVRFSASGSTVTQVYGARRPSAQRIETYRAERAKMAPTHPSTAPTESGYQRRHFARDLGHGPTVFESACAGLRHWAGHANAGVEIHPSGADLAEGLTVAIVTRQLGVWVLAACRIETVVEESDAFGFTYATLPGHPERGHESFTIRQTPEGVRFEIDVVSQPASTLVRMTAPVGRSLQRRITSQYLDGLKASSQPRPKVTDRGPTARPSRWRPGIGKVTRPSDQQYRRTTLDRRRPCPPSHDEQPTQAQERVP